MLWRTNEWLTFNWQTLQYAQFQSEFTDKMFTAGVDSKHLNSGCKTTAETNNVAARPKKPSGVENHQLMSASSLKPFEACFCFFFPPLCTNVREEGRWPWLSAPSLSLRGIVTLHWRRRLHPLRRSGRGREVTGASYARVTRQEFSDSRPRAATHRLTHGSLAAAQAASAPPPLPHPPLLF